MRPPKKVLFENGIDVDTPKNVFRELAKLGWIDSAEPWLLFLNNRNKTSYICKKEIAEQVFAVIPNFIEHANLLMENLEVKVQRRHLN